MAASRQSDRRVVSAVGTSEEANSRIGMRRELTRHRLAYLLLGLILTGLFGAVASLALPTDSKPRFEALVVAIGPGPLAGTAESIFDSEAFADEVIGETDIDLSRPEFYSSASISPPDSSTLRIEVVFRNAEQAEDLANAAAGAVAVRLAEEGFFTRPLQAQPVGRDVSWFRQDSLALGLASASLVVLLAAGSRARSRPSTPADPATPTAATSSENAQPQRSPVDVEPQKTDSQGDSQQSAASPDVEADQSPGSRASSDLHAKLSEAARLQRALLERRDDEAASNPVGFQDPAALMALHRRRLRDQDGDRHSSQAAPDMRTSPDQVLTERDDEPRAPNDDSQTDQAESDPGTLQSKLRIAMLLQKSFGESIERERRGQLSLDHQGRTEGDSVFTAADASELVEKISGIGTVYATRLARLGITTCEQLAECGPAFIARMVKTKQSNAESWIIQARDFCAGTDSSSQSQSER